MSPDGLAPHKTSKLPNGQFLVSLWGVVTEPRAIGAFEKHSCYITTLRKKQEQTLNHWNAAAGEGQGPN